uniref:Uncharacterized protein n=1 Tax=Nelumbo nucifera TaxID=4432 RepID=A0A822Z8V1_NELNU|nr:TPA_asm: hypothetical protein HUJ06_008579 [Nelumbo nucifera]
MNTRVRITHHRENQNIHMEEEEDQVVEVVRDASLLLAHALFVCLFLCKRARKEGLIGLHADRRLGNQASNFQLL